MIVLMQGDSYCVSSCDMHKLNCFALCHHPAAFEDLAPTSDSEPAGMQRELYMSVGVWFITPQRGATFPSVAIIG